MRKSKGDGKMSDLKSSWAQTAKSFVLAFNDLAISLVDSIRAGRDIAVEWARKDNPHVQNSDSIDTDGVEVEEDDAAKDE